MKETGNILMTYLKVTQHMSRLFRDYFGKLQITFPQALVLTVLGESGPMPVSALAERTGSANSTVSGIVDRLERLGLAARERSGADRRVIYVAATDKYYDLSDQAQIDVGGYFDLVMSGLTGEERGRVAEALVLLDRALGQQDSAAHQDEAPE